MKASLLASVRLLIAFVGLAAVLATATAAGEPGKSVRGSYAIGLSPFYSSSIKNDLYRRILGFLLEEMPLNSSLFIYDAYHLRTIAQVDIPSLRAFQSGKTRAIQFKEPIGKLKEFLAANHEPPATNKLKLDAAIRFPQFLDFLSANLPERSAVVIVLANPLYIDPKEPAFSMIEGYFPSDGHLLASREQSVFGIQSRGRALKQFVVHFGYFGDPWMSDLHQEKIARFWSLYVKGQEGRLATFCGDLATVFNAVHVRSTNAAPWDAAYEINREQSKIEMIRITRDVGVADWITRDLPPGVQHGPPSATTGPMKIGIRWQGNIDLDLYATPRSGAETLFFEHTRTSEGYYFKDHRSSPDREYEFIEFESPVDVWRVRASVNFYEGTVAGGASGEIRIEFEGKIFAGQFSIPARHGNKGRSGTSQRDFWHTIDVPAILKLPRDRPVVSRQP